LEIEYDEAEQKSQPEERTPAKVLSRKAKASPPPGVSSLNRIPFLTSGSMSLLTGIVVAGRSRVRLALMVWEAPFNNSREVVRR
jgi:hypothetical protein